MNLRMIWSSEVAGFGGSGRHSPESDKMDISERKLQRGGRRARAGKAQRGSCGRRPPARKHIENLTIILGKSGYFVRGGTLMRPAV
jgi:hypothetical protein